MNELERIASRSTHAEVPSYIKLALQDFVQNIFHSKMYYRKTGNPHCALGQEVGLSAVSVFLRIGTPQPTRYRLRA